MRGCILASTLATSLSIALAACGAFSGSDSGAAANDAAAGDASSVDGGVDTSSEAGGSAGEGGASDAGVGTGADAGPACSPLVVAFDCSTMPPGVSVDGGSFNLTTMMPAPDGGGSSCELYANSGGSAEFSIAYARHVGTTTQLDFDVLLAGNDLNTIVDLFGCELDTRVGGNASGLFLSMPDLGSQSVDVHFESDAGQAGTNSYALPSGIFIANAWSHVTYVMDSTTGKKTVTTTGLGARSYTEVGTASGAGTIGLTCGISNPGDARFVLVDNVVLTTTPCQ